MKSRITFFLFSFLISAFWFPASGYAACTSPTGAAGHMMYNADAHIPQYCNGVSWVVMAPTINLPTTNGLVGYWKLDDASGTNAGDSSGNNNTGTLQNSPVWTNGYYNGALSFDGATNYVDLGAGAGLNFAANAAFSISAWLKTTDGYGGIVSLRNSSDFGVDVDLMDGYDGSTDSTGHLMALVRQDGDWGGDFAEVVGGIINDGTWHNVMLTRNTAGAIELFLDGISQGTSSNTGSGGSLTTDQRGIGIEKAWFVNSYGSSDQQYLTGIIDDVRIYNRALSAAEISTLYNYHISPPSSGLVGYWEFDESSGTAVADSSGTGNTGTLVNGPTFTSAGKLAGALTFNGTNSYVSVPNASSIANMTSFTYAAWVYPYSNGGFPGGAIFSKNDKKYMRMYYGSLSASVVMTGSNATVTTGALTLNTWQYLTMTFDGTDTTVLYQNGVLLGSDTGTGSPQADSAGSLFLGNMSTADQGFNGLIDDARVYNRALSADEVYGLYRTSSPVCSNPSDYEGDMMYNAGTNHVVQFCDNASWRPLGPVPGAGGSGCTSPAHPEGDMIYSDTGAGSGVMQYCDGTNWVKIGGPNLPTSGLAGYWKFDEGSGTTAADSSGNGNTGTLTNGISPTWTTNGKDAGALMFTGTNQYVDAGDPASLRLAGSWTVSAWVNPTALPTGGNYYTLVEKDTAGYLGNYSLSLQTSGWAIIFQDTGGTAYHANYATSISTGTWYLVTGVWDSVGQNLYLYVNGALVATQNETGHVPDANSGRNLIIGKENGGGDNFPGTLDEVRVYNRALSAQEIWQLYNGT